MIRRTLAIAIKELLQLRRDWRTAATLLGMPVVLLMIYGFALTFDVQDVRLAIVDLSSSRASREVAESFFKSGYFKPVGRPADIRELDALFDSGHAQAAVVIPADFSRRLAAHQLAELQLVLDGSDSQTASTILGYARQITATLGSGMRLASPPGIQPRPVVWYNPDLESTIFLVPGLLAFMLMITSVIATALAVVREKERGTMESLRATPLRAIEILLGKTLPYLILASTSAIGSLALAWLMFDVPIRGSLVSLAFVTILFLAGGLGWGVLLSTIADSQQVAFQLALISSMLPTILLSGFIFPLSSMPNALQVISHIVPATYYIAALRDIMLKAAPLEVWVNDVVGLVVYSTLVLLLATVRMVRSL